MARSARHLPAHRRTDIPTTCEFILDYEDDADDTDGQPSKRKKPWRWPDEIRDEVLGRLLELNSQRAREEQLKGAEEAAKINRPGRRKRAIDTPLLDG